VSVLFDNVDADLQRENEGIESGAPSHEPPKSLAAKPSLLDPARLLCEISDLLAQLGAGDPIEANTGLGSLNGQLTVNVWWYPDHELAAVGSASDRFGSCLAS